LPIHCGGEGERAGSTAVGVDVGQVRCQDRRGLFDCVAVSDLSRQLSQGDGGEATPVVGEDVAPLPLSPEPEAIPVPDRDLMEADVRLRPTKGPKPAQCRLEGVKHGGIAIKTVSNVEERYQWRDDRLFVVDFMSG
jgi:hypothetical protein